MPLNCRGLHLIRTLQLIFKTIYSLHSPKKWESILKVTNIVHGIANKTQGMDRGSDRIPDKLKNPTIPKQTDTTMMQDQITTKARLIKTRRKSATTEKKSISSNSAVCNSICISI